MESLILYGTLFLVIFFGIYLVFKINSIQKNLNKEQNNEDLNSLKDSLNSQINSNSK